MKRLRIAHVIQHFAEGEVEHAVKLLIQGCQAHDVDSVVVGTLGEGSLRGELEARGVRTHLLPLDGASARTPGRLAALLASEGVDAVHTHHAGSFVVAATAAHMLGLPALHTEHDHQLYASVRVRGQGVTRSLPGGAAGEHALLSGAGDLSMRTVLIANGIELRTRPTRYERAHVRAQLNLHPDAFVFGSVARWSTQSAALELVEAFARTALQHPHALLLMACDAPTRTALSARAVTLGLGHRVRFLGQPESVGPWLPALDAFVVNSMHARATLEAMNAELPVIGTAVGGLPSLLRNGAGAVLASGDMVGVSQTMSAFVTSPWLCDAYSTLGRARVEAEHSVQAMTLAYAVLYRAACAPRPADTVQAVRCAAHN